MRTTNTPTWEQWYSAVPEPYYGDLDDPRDPVGGAKNYRLLANSNGGYGIAAIETMLASNSRAMYLHRT